MEPLFPEEKLSKPGVLTQIAAMQTRVLNASMKARGMGIDPTIERVKAEFYSQIVPALESKPPGK